MVKTTNKNEPREYLLLNLYDVMLVENKSMLIIHLKKASVFSSFTSRSYLMYLIRLIWLMTMEDMTECWKNFHPSRRTLLFMVSNYTFTFVSRARKNKMCCEEAYGCFWFQSSCEVDLTDFQSHPGRKYNFIVVYQDLF